MRCVESLSLCCLAPCFVSGTRRKRWAKRPRPQSTMETFSNVRTGWPWLDALENAPHETKSVKYLIFLSPCSWMCSIVHWYALRDPQMLGLRPGGGSSTAKTGPHVKWQPYDILMILKSTSRYRYNYASSTRPILICMKPYLRADIMTYLLHLLFTYTGG